MTDDSKIYSECQAERSASEIQQKIDMVLRAEDLHNIPEGPAEKTGLSRELSLFIHRSFPTRNTLQGSGSLSGPTLMR